MPTFESFDGRALFFEASGTGEPVILLHSFPFDSRVWTNTGVVPAVVRARRSAIVLDRRGHGRSERPHDPAAYGENAAARDVSCLMDHLGLDSADLVGYSLGSQIGLRVIQAEPRIRRAVLGGIGHRVLDWDQDRADRIAGVLEHQAPPTDPAGAWLWRTAEDLGGDRIALAAEWRGRFVEYAPDFAAVTADVLIVTGVRDRASGEPRHLARRLPRARVLELDTDHASTMDHPDFVRGALEFLAE